MNKYLFTSTKSNSDKRYDTIYSEMLSRKDKFISVPLIRNCLNNWIQKVTVSLSTKMDNLSTGSANETSCKLTNIKTFVFLDIETTGLPSQEHNKTKLTELSMIAVQADHIRLGVFPRVQNKLTFCFNPRKMVSLGAEELTGLSNQLLEYQATFTSDAVKLINGFLSQNQSPVCLVAHNGNNFDYPVLRAEINKTNSTLENVICIDSLVAFQQLYLEERESQNSTCDTTDASTTSVPIEFTSQYDELLFEASQGIENTPGHKVEQIQKANETTPRKQIIGQSIPPKKIKLMCPATQRFDLGLSFKLGDLYRRLTNRTPINAHYAESDVLMLITCAATMGDKFVNWCKKNSRRFCDIPPMTPGRKIGT